MVGPFSFDPIPMTQKPTWITIELDAGASQFLDLPKTLTLPWDGSTSVLQHAGVPGSIGSLADALERAVQIHPEMSADAKVHRFLARRSQLSDLEAFWNVGNATFAVKVAGDMLAADSQDPVALATMGRAALERDEFKEAVSRFEKVLDKAPDHAPTQFDFAVALSGAGELEKARHLFGKLQQNKKVDQLAALFAYEVHSGRVDSLGSRLGASRALFRSLTQEASVEDIRSLNQLFPDNPAAKYFLATHPQGHDSEELRAAALEEVLELQPGHAPARSILAAHLRRSRSAAAAAKLLEQAPDPNHPLLLSAKGQCLEQLGQAEQALAVYRGVFELPLKDLPVSVLIASGHGLLRTGNPEEVRFLFEDAVKAREKDPAPYQLLSRLEDLCGSETKAELALRTALKKCGPSTGLVYALGDLLRRQGRTSEAKATFKSLIQDTPQEPWGHRGLGDLALGQDTEKALTHYSRALDLDPSSPIPGLDYLRGLQALREKNFAEAESLFHRAVAAEPDQAKYWGDLGAARFYNRNTSGAVEATLRARHLDPQNPGYAHNLAAYYREHFRSKPLTHWKSFFLSRRFKSAARKLSKRKQEWKQDLWRQEDSKPSA